MPWISSGGYPDPVYGSTGFYSTPESVNSGYIYWHDTSPGSSYDTIRKWTAPAAATISITGRVYKEDTSGGAGIIASVEKNGTSIWSRTVAYNDTTGYTTDASLGAISVSSGDSIAFVADDNGSYGPVQPKTYWDPTISMGPVVKINGGGGAIDGLSADTDYTGGSSYTTPNPCVFNTYGIPDAFRTCRAASSFSYTIPSLGTGLYNVNLYFDEGWQSSAGVRLMDIKVNGGPTPVLSNFDVYVAGGNRQNTGVVEAIPVVSPVSGSITLNFAESAGSTDIAMVSAVEITPVTVAINGGGAAVDGLSADADYTGGSSYTTPNPCSSNTYGIPNALRTCRGGTSFSYSIPSLSPGSYSVNLYFDEGWDASANFRLMDITINGIQVLSKFDVYAAAGNHLNTGVLRTIPNVTVTSSGTITINVAESSGSSDLAMVSAIEVIQNPNALTVAPSWTLSTSDTQLGLGIAGNTPVITMLKDTVTNWNWISSSPVPIPLINNLYIGGTQYAPNWTYTNATVDTTSGTKVTLAFGSTTPSLTLTQTWWAHPGVGPVEQTTTLQNNTGSDVSINDTDVVAADVVVTADNAVTLWRFDRANVIDSDSDFRTGVLKTGMGTTTTISSTVSNQWGGGTFELPFDMLDVGGIHGLYMGYECDFGKFTVSTSGISTVLCTVFQLWNSSSFTVSSGSTISLPGMFYGAYTGDTDTGSNHMKKWFWDNKMTPTIKSTSNEPLVEAAAAIDAESQAIPFFTTQYPSLATWGVELVKEDQGWTDDWNNPSDGIHGWDWTYNSTTWPNGFTEGTLAHGHGVKLDLYMANTFNNVDLSTAAGVTSEEGALIARYDPSSVGGWHGGYDYWRTDVACEADLNYMSHLGFMQVLDYMISNRSGFRWENCSAGGSKKSFDLLQRQSIMCVEDSGGNVGAIENYRMSYYPASYMINPVQLQSQNIANNSYPDTPAVGNYMFRIGFMGAWMNYLDKGYPSKQDGLYGLTIPLYTAHQRPILRGADVYHILQICDGTHWDGIEYFNSALNKGSVILLKPDSSVTTFPGVYLKGLIPTGTYSLKFQDRNGLNSSYTSVTGSALMSGGGIGSFSGTANEYDSEIIWINY